MNDNILLLTDSYKITHRDQYPPDTQNIYSYFESRGGQFKELVFFGLQYFLQRYLCKQITNENLKEAHGVYSQHFGKDTRLFNWDQWDYLIKKHNGFLPVSIRAIPEGMVVPVLTPLITVENTDPIFYWVTNFLETLLVQCWYPITVATLSREIKKVILGYLKETGTESTIDFRLHDFGFRGVSSPESAALGGAAHLVNFKGTDTVPALLLAKKYYNEEMAGFSIPASEHSTMTTWGKNNELEAYNNMLKQYANSNPGAVAVVSDSYDIFNACENIWGRDLKNEVLNSKFTTVIRPDSGDPVKTLLKVMDILFSKYDRESTINQKGYRVLPDKLRIIQGDGVDLNAIKNILNAFKINGYSADNISFGMGGGLLQKLDRDTMKFAFKCSSATIHNKQVDVFKDPITDPGKQSKRGRFYGLPEVFRNGKLLTEYSLDFVRHNANKGV